jgi:rhamnose utilization protein RhaD (predicted bifunctional aldolase and dehydrogenase)/NAD(P)-dependent dehydrogenase (short-subunit alcohol dehydrogenase family)
MKNQWSSADLSNLKSHSGIRVDSHLLETVYLTNMVGRDPALALHGGGNTSVKCTSKNVFNEETAALFVKASGFDMAKIGPDGFVGLELGPLQKLQKLPALSDEGMADQFRKAALSSGVAQPSIETLLHAFIDKKFIVHTHPAAILALTNRDDGMALVQRVFGDRVVIIPYVKVGFELAVAAANAFSVARKAEGLIISHHGLVTWGDTAEEAYGRTIEIVSAAEKFIAQNVSRTLSAPSTISCAEALARYQQIAPVVRGLLADRQEATGVGGGGIVLKPLISESILKAIGSLEGKALFKSVPITPDYLIRTKTVPLWIENPEYDTPAAFRDQLTKGLAEFSAGYTAYINRNKGADETAVGDLLPRTIVLSGIGIVCAGTTDADAAMIRDIIEQGISVKTDIFETGGTYRGLTEDHLYDMEYRSYQRAKLDNKKSEPLSGSIALVTGSAGAIGVGICEALLSRGCHVAVSDLRSENFTKVIADFTARYGSRVLGVELDVTDPLSVAKGFGEITANWGGIDSVIINAGIAHVSSLDEMELDQFRKLEKVNVEGTLLCIKEASKLFKRQNCGGDIVLISTKNVFAPGAKFGAYSATKAAAHQLARIASLELAPLGVRVNMVAPDAVFSHGATKSGLWAAVGPDRMRARGLDEAGLEEYYRQRNLLKAKITASHVANAVMFFITRQTPTTGATIPVDGGLPDATPR